MNKNLIQAPAKESVFISSVTDPAVASLLAESGIEEGSEIVKSEEGDDVKSKEQIVEIENDKSGAKLRLSVNDAKEIFVRSCDICWNCGECMNDKF